MTEFVKFHKDELKHHLRPIYETLSTVERMNKGKLHAILDEYSRNAFEVNNSPRNFGKKVKGLKYSEMIDLMCIKEKNLIGRILSNDVDGDYIYLNRESVEQLQHFLRGPLVGEVVG